MTTDVSFGEPYTPLLKFKQDLTMEQKMLCFDQAKTNLFWLVEPRMDTEGLGAAKDNPKAADIHTFMDAVTRRHLQGLPLPFLTYWLHMDKNRDTQMAQHWGDYVPMMIERANEAHARLAKVEAPNVVKVDFLRRRAA